MLNELEAAMKKAELQDKIHHEELTKANQKMREMEMQRQYEVNATKQLESNLHSMKVQVDTMCCESKQCNVKEFDFGNSSKIK